MLPGGEANDIWIFLAGIILMALFAWVGSRL